MRSSGRFETRAGRLRLGTMNDRVSLVLASLLSFLGACSGSNSGGTPGAGALTVVVNTPLADAVKVPAFEIVSATFSEALDATAVDASWVVVRHSGDVTPVAVASSRLPCAHCRRADWSKSS